MQLLTRFASWWSLGLGLAMILVLGAFWWLGSEPWQLGAWVYLDALSLWFILLALLALVLVRRSQQSINAQDWFGLGGLLLALISPQIVVICLGLGVFIASQQRISKRTWLANSAAGVAWLALVAGYGAIAWRGAWALNDRLAGSGLDNFSFWFVLLAALIPVIPWRQAQSGLLTTLAQVALAYPLVRLYSLGPWNNGWTLATLLLGCCLALWITISACRNANPSRIPLSFAALAVASFGLGSGAGLVAGCFCGIAALILAYPMAYSHKSNRPELVWLLSCALPLGVPFYAAWMSFGASVAGGVPIVGGVVWLTMLFNCIALLAAQLYGALPVDKALVALNIGLGVGSPLLVRWLIQPIIEQLQGGFSPFGDVNIWPWVGISSVNSARSQVSTAPSIAILLLLLVLSALVYVLARLFSTWQVDQQAITHNQQQSPQNLLDILRLEVPWLALLLPAQEPTHEPE